MNIEGELLAVIKQLSELQKFRLLDFVNAMLISQDKKPPRNLLKFAGAIEKDELKQIQSTIEEDCGKIDSNEW